MYEISDTVGGVSPKSVLVRTVHGVSATLQFMFLTVNSSKSILGTVASHDVCFQYLIRNGTFFGIGVRNGMVCSLATFSWSRVVVCRSFPRLLVPCNSVVSCCILLQDFFSQVVFPWLCLLLANQGPFQLHTSNVPLEK